VRDVGEQGTERDEHADIELARDLVPRREGRFKTSTELALGELASLRLAGACVTDDACRAWLDAQCRRAHARMARAPLELLPLDAMLHEIERCAGDIDQLAPDEELAVDAHLRREAEVLP
jgi:hypothetical protein